MAVWLSASRVHKMLGAKLGFRVHITSADLLPSTAGAHLQIQYNASSVFSAATLLGRLTGNLQRELSPQLLFDRQRVEDIALDSNND